jgi:hypothetical protein
MKRIFCFVAETLSDNFRKGRRRKRSIRFACRYGLYPRVDRFDLLQITNLFYQDAHAPTEVLLPKNFKTFIKVSRPEEGNIRTQVDCQEEDCRPLPFSLSGELFQRIFDNSF